MSSARFKAIGGLFGAFLAVNGVLGQSALAADEGHAKGAPAFLRPGFGLNFHRGVGYGGGRYGVGPDGGYPSYGGPGYVHCNPPLVRFHEIVPFSYYDGTSPRQGARAALLLPVGPLRAEPPTVRIAAPPDMPQSDFGTFTGALPYPETYFAPYAGEAGQSSGARKE